MRVSKSIVFGLVSLVCTVNATQVMGNVLAKRQSTITSTVIMTGTPPSTSTTIDGWSDDDCCIAICLISDEDDWDCQFIFPPASSSLPATLTSPALPTSDAASVEPREQISGTFGDCTALCWDLMPGTECDVQCASDFKTKMPVPSKAARVANLKARENLQVQQVREARLARKFGGNVAPDDELLRSRTPHQLLPRTTAPFPTVEIFTSWVPIVSRPSNWDGASEYSAKIASFAVVSSKQAASSEATSLSSAMSPLNSEVFSSTSASSVATPLPIFVNVTVAAPASTGSAPTVKATRTSIVSTATASANKTALSISSKTSTASTTTTVALNVSYVGAPSATHFIATTYDGSAAQQYTGSTGLVLSLLVGLAANVAFLI